MYVLVKNNFVFAGPNIWHPKLFTTYIEDDFELTMTLPTIAPTSGTNLGNDIFCYDLININIPVYNEKIQKLDGPFYTFENNIATQTFNVVDKGIDHVKSDLLSQIATTRWEKEIAGVDFTVQGQVVKLSTARNSRDLYQQSLQLLQSTDTIMWKFDTIWILLTYTELESIVVFIKNYVQSCFAWEKQVADQITACSTLVSLNEVVLTYPIN